MRRRHAFYHEALVYQDQASATVESAEEAEHLLRGDGARAVATNPVACFTPVTTTPLPKELSMHVPWGSVAHLLGGRQQARTGGES